MPPTRTVYGSARDGVEVGDLLVRVALVAADVLHVGEARVPDQLERVDVHVVEVGLERRIDVESPRIRQRRAGRHEAIAGEEQTGGWLPLNTVGGVVGALNVVFGNKPPKYTRRNVVGRDLHDRAARLVPLRVRVLEPAFEVLADVEFQLAFDVQVVADVAFGSVASLTSRKNPSPWPPVLPEALKRSQSVIGPEMRAVEDLRVVVAGDRAHFAFPGVGGSLGDHVRSRRRSSCGRTACPAGRAALRCAR